MADVTETCMMWRTSDAKMPDKVSSRYTSVYNNFCIGNDFGVSEGLKEGCYGRT